MSAPQNPLPVPNTASEQRRAGKSKVRIRIFSLPKPFTGDSDRIQRNAVGSWKRLAEVQDEASVSVLLFGDEAGIADAAQEMQVDHCPTLPRNEFGTPLLRSAFLRAQQADVGDDANIQDWDIVVYCNADVILEGDFIAAVTRLALDREIESFVAIGRRFDVNLEAPLQFGGAGRLAVQMSAMRATAVPASIVCKEFFAFRPGTFDDIPEFAVGRGNWDNWMVASAKRKRVAVIDIGPVAKVWHQNHAYQHMAEAEASRYRCYVSGDEARENQRLAGGQNLITGSTPTHRLTEDGLVRVPLSGLNLAFWKDVGNFSRLVRQLLR